MPFLIPTTQDAAAAITVTLSETLYVIRTRWVPRNESWYISVELTDGTKIIDFEKVTPQQALVNYNKESFSGQLFLIPNEEDAIPLNRNNFGQSYTYRLWYFDEEDLEIFDSYNAIIAGGYFV